MNNNGQQGTVQRSDGRDTADGLTSEWPIVYSDNAHPNQVKAYHYHFWIKPPTVMLRDKLVSFLRAAKVSDRVVTPEMRAQADYALTGRIKHLEQVRQEKGSRTLIQVELGLRRSRDGKILYLNTFKAENDAGGPGVDDAVESLNTALTIIYSDFLADLAKL